MHNVLALGLPGSWEWIVVLIIALLIFGKKLPDVARSIGKSMTAFKKGLHEVDDVRDEVSREVDKVADDVAKDVKDAAGLNDTDKEV